MWRRSPPTAPTSCRPEERIATFDNDGTLWSEKPIPIQLDFTLHRMAEMAKTEAALQGEQDSVTPGCCV
jgi:hypothetical protein